MNTKKISYTIDNLREKGIIRRLIILSIGLLITITVIIIISISISNIFRISNIIAVDNYDALNIDIPNNAKDEFQEVVYYVLKNHFDVPDAPTSVKATIRPETVKYDDSGSIKGVNFVLDIDEYRQSFDTYINWSETEECVSQDLSKYPDATCYGMNYSSNSPSKYLPFRGRLKTGETFFAAYDSQDQYGNEHITVIVQDCGQDSAKDKAVSAVKDYLKIKGGFDSEQFIYRKISDNSECNN